MFSAEHGRLASLRAVSPSVCGRREEETEKLAAAALLSAIPDPSGKPEVFRIRRGAPPHWRNRRATVLAEEARLRAVARLALAVRSRRPVHGTRGPRSDGGRSRRLPASSEGDVRLLRPVGVRPKTPPTRGEDEPDEETADVRGCSGITIIAKASIPPPLPPAALLGVDESAAHDYQDAAEHSETLKTPRAVGTAQGVLGIDGGGRALGEV